MQANPTTHPRVDQLNAFALGKLESTEVDAVESHLASCDTCCDALKQMQEDTFVGLVRQSKEATHEGDAAVAFEVTLAAANPPGEEQSSVSAAAAHAEGRQDIPTELANHARYRVVGLLGKGGMGEVYKAEHRLMERMVALKVINPKFVGSKQAVERFRREVQAAARLDHANIVRAHDAEQAGNLHFLVMEHIEGTDLGKALERGPLPVAEACEYIRQAALGLEHAHERGMVHRDIKPQNLILSRLRESHESHATIKILDFGIASLTEGAAPTINADEPSIPDFQKPGLTQAGFLWDSATGKEIRRWEGMVTDGHNSVAFLPDGKSIVASGADNVIRLLPLHLPAKTDAELIQGVWRPESAEFMGKPVPAEFMKAVRVTFLADKLTWKGNVPAILTKFIDGLGEKSPLPKDFGSLLVKGVEGVYHIDSTKAPKSIDLSVLGELRKTALGIYELDGDTLKLCLAYNPERVDQRPIEFATKAGVLQGLVVLKRLREHEMHLFEGDHLPRLIEGDRPRP